MESTRPRLIQAVPLSTDSAPLLHQLYERSPAYFSLIGMEIPSLADVEQEVRTIQEDPRRRAQLLFHKGQVVGYLDYKLDYPEDGVATISLLLIEEACQRQGLGTAVIEDLEEALKGQVKALYAIVYGDNPVAKIFWIHRGFRHLKDGGPSVSWYAKRLSSP
jgi:ribosomal protein S18 acetylase RimI-like enzyme